jgi:Family of unknown function (DUF5335)
MAGFIEQSQWKNFLDEFSKRNQFRPTRLEILNVDGAQEEEQFLPLVGVSFEAKGAEAGSVLVTMGGETVNDDRYVEHRIAKVERIAPIIGPTGFEDGLGFEDREGGKTLLLLEKLPELPENTSDSDRRASPPMH